MGVLLLLWWNALIGGGAPAAHFPDQAYTAAELWKPLAVIHGSDGARHARGHSNVAFFKGHLLVPYAVDGGKRGGGLAIYDVRDPRRPRLVARVDEPLLREAHGFAFSSGARGDLAVFQTTAGIEFWDLTDITRPTVMKRLTIPNIAASDYDQGAWWLFWQAPYVYVAGSGNGLYVVDASDIATARVVARLDASRSGGFRVGSVFALGNLMVLASSDQPGLATLDISDPLRPTLLAATKHNPDSYSSILAGERILSAGTDGSLIVHDVSDPTRIRLVNRSPIAAGNAKGGYVSFQDGFALVGFSSQVAKIDIRDDGRYRVVGTGSSGLPGRDEDFGTAIGNLVFVGDDHGVGSAILAHQQLPDRLGPAVGAVNPRPLASRQKATTRIGVSFSDAVDPTSLGAATFIVRPIGGATLPGRYSAQLGIANFAPDAPLEPDTTYEVVIPAGGVRDYAGNGVPARFASRFSTGPSVGTPLSCTIDTAAPVLVGAAATVAVTTAGLGPRRISFAFDDGSDATPPSAAPSATHAYSTPGHHAIIATVENERETATCSRLQTVYAPLTAERPTSASTIILDPATALVWVVNPDADSVTAIDGETRRKRLEVPVGAAPRTLARAPDGTVWVVSQDSASISVLDGASGAPRATIALPPRSRPYGLAFAPDGGAAYVTLQGTGTLVELSAAGRAVRRSVALGAPLRGVAVSADSRRVLVARFISPADHGEVMTVDARTLTVAATTVLAKDPGPDTEASGRGVPNYLGAVVISPDGSYALVPSKKDNTDRGLARDGRPLSFESTVRTIVSHIDLASGAERLERRVDFNDRDMAQAAAFSKYGDYVAVVMQGSGAVEILDAQSRAAVSGISSDGFAPQGVAFSADFSKLYVDNFLSRTVTVYDASGLIDATSTLLPRLAVVPTVEHERLAAAVLRGKQIFYDASDRRMNRDGYLSCASCHLDGDSDGRVWDLTSLGQGPRNTTSLVGHGGMRQGFVHWTGNFDEIQDFEHPIRELFGGTGFLSDAAFHAGTRDRPLGDPKAGASPDLDALAAYVSSLAAVHPSPSRAPDGALTAPAIAGKALFGRLGCARCHGGFDLTDSAAGRLHHGFDTPTLKGIWETAPYLHDGSAATLRDVLASHEVTAPLAGMTQVAVGDRENAADWSLRSRISVGDKAFGDRGYTIAALPPELAGMSWLRPANDSKGYAGPSLVSFVLDRAADVHVSIDDRRALPKWIDGSWSELRAPLAIRESATVTRPCTVYRKSFPAGRVSLGSWGSTANTYAIIVK